MKAAINNHLELVKMLLMFGANPRLKTESGESSLTLACMQENFEICKRLIISRADVNECDYMKRTPLLKAARHNAQTHIIELLLENGAKLEKADGQGNTPLHYCAMRGTVEVAGILLQRGADPYFMNKSKNALEIS